MEMEIADKRVIVIDETDKKKYTLPDFHEAAFLMDGTSERVRVYLKQWKYGLLYGQYRAYPYSETKWDELRKNGYSDGKLYDIYKMRLNSIFGGVYR